MNTYAMRTFLTPDNIKLHLNHLKTLRAKHSIIEKSISEIRGKSIREIAALNIKKHIKNEILPNFISIKSHELYFSSFILTTQDASEARNAFPHQASFLYDFECAANDARSEFIFVFTERGKVIIKELSSAHGVFITETPILALDLAEHSYFLDYRFDRASYIHNAIEHLDVSAISKYLK